MKKEYIFALIGLAVVVGIAVYTWKPVDRSMESNNSIGNEIVDDSGSLNMIIDDSSPIITKQGRILCLPHKNTEGPQTMECAMGFKAIDGIYYALDGGDMPDQIDMAPMDKDLRVEGRLTPVEALSTDFWQRYPIAGIITVTAIEEI